ncbi:hypothetical protein AAMO2058_000597000 [Amorphochlora amoebiformis]
MSAPPLVTRNGELWGSKGPITPSPSPRNWLESLPIGAYTVASVKKMSDSKTQTSTIQLQHQTLHLKRLLESHYAITNTKPLLPSSQRHKNAVSRILKAWKETLSQFQLAQKSKGYIPPLMVTTLLLSNSTDFDTWVHVRYMPTAKLAVTAQVVGKPRNMPLVKNSAWILQRIPIEKSKEAGVDEAILSDGDNLYEGLTSNFFVVRKGVVETAPYGVLEGVMRETVIQACKAENIPLKFRFPRISEADTWTECFVTNTVKVVAEISMILLPRHQILTANDEKTSSQGSNSGKITSKSPKISSKSPKIISKSANITSKSAKTSSKSASISSKTSELELQAKEFKVGAGTIAARLRRWILRKSMLNY